MNIKANLPQSICFFVGYTETDHQDDLPYIKELARHFDKVLVLTNKIPKDPTLFDYLILPNSGYDFGFLYRAVTATDLSSTHTMAFVNNSNFLIKDLDDFFSWCDTKKSGLYGITDSFGRPPGLKLNNSYHLQSHFLIFKGEAVHLLIDFFSHIDFPRFFKTRRLKKLRQKIINECEVGLSQFMIGKHITLESYYKAEHFNPKHNRTKETNMHVMLWEELIAAGYPLIKKKIIRGEWDAIIPNPQNRNKYPMLNHNT